jgi:transmembrane sensor
MENESAEELIRKYLEGTATPEEDALLETWYLAAAQDQPEMPGVPDYEKIRDDILQPLRAEQLRLPKITSPIRLWPRIAAAASVLVILAIGCLFVLRKRPTQGMVESQLVENDIMPASSKATLTLVDGRTVPLDSIGRSTLAPQGNAVISTLDGQLIYSTNQRSAPEAGSVFNTLSTGSGEHYSLLLPDGTKVWLNAASSITYPVVFNGKERKVKVTGELYFEIVHNSKQPFRVSVKDQLVEDIGTHLNISAYDEEPGISTTLLEGSIMIMKGKTSVILTPGQQARMGPHESSFQIKQVGTDEAIAWKNGYFYFDRADIKTVMREFARWYNVQVVYTGNISKRTFKGKVYRNINASEALSILSYFGAHVRIRGKTITISS